MLNKDVKISRFKSSKQFNSARKCYFLIEQLHILLFFSSIDMNDILEYLIFQFFLIRVNRGQ